MYEYYYGFKEKPFQINPDPNFLYLSPNHDHALKYLEYGIERNIGIILLTGEVGSGKTTLIQYLRRQIGPNLELAVLSNTNLSADQLLSYILIELGIESESTGKAHNLNLFKNHLKSLDSEGRRIILVIDEAQNLPKDALEEVRMLSNFQADDSMPLQIFLIGQPELRTILKSPGMHQIRQRIAVNYHLNGLNREETQNYIEYRLKKAGANQNPFTAEAVDLIFQSATGIPRSINILCDSALLYGFAEEVPIVDAEIVNSVLNDLNLQTFIQKEPRVDPNRSEKPPAAATPRASQAILETQTQSRPDDDLLKKVLLVIKKQLDKIDIKIDILRDDVLKKVNGSLIVEKKRYEDLLVEHAKIQVELDRLKAAVETGGLRGEAQEGKEVLEQGIEAAHGERAN
jgi:general secretion pathway protein A